MKRKFTLLAVCLTVGFGLFLGFNITDNSPTGSRTNSIDLTPRTNAPAVQYDNSVIKFQDNMDGANDTTALKSRGYWPFYRGTGPQGTTATWYQGSTPFPAFNGPSTGYTAANYNAVTGANNIDSWLILPKANINAGDTLTFYERSTASATFLDSMRVMWSASGDSTPEGSWVELGRFENNNTGVWTQHNYVAPSGSNGRFAVRYAVVNGGPSGSNSDYIGIDAFTVHGPAGPPPGGCAVTAGMWAPAATYPNMPVANYFSASAWLGDTLYVQSAGAGTGSTTIYRYTVGGSWSTGVSAPVTRTGASLTAANGKLYLIGGGSTTITAGTNTVYEYNPSTGAWISRANMPAALSAHSSVNWGDSVIFVVGGPYTGSATNLNVHYYRIGSDTWGTITGSLPAGQGRRTFGLGIYGNKIVMSAGFNTAFLKSTYIGTIGTNAGVITWAAAPDVPTSYTGLSRPGGAHFDKFFFLVGGERGGLGGYYDTVHVFDIDNGNWLPNLITGKPVPTSNIFNQTVAKCVNDTIKIFVPGAYNGAASNSFDVTQGGVLTGIEQPGVNLPEKFSLSQNYPNPFNPTTAIRFEIPEMTFVTLKVYDMAGREVASLINDIRGAGTYIVNFDGANLASGTYFYRIQAGDFVQVKKMVLLK